MVATLFQFVPEDNIFELLKCSKGDEKKKGFYPKQNLGETSLFLVTEFLCNINHSSQNILFNQVEFEFYVYICFPVANGPKSETQQGYCFLFDQIFPKFLSPVVFR